MFVQLFCSNFLSYIRIMFLLSFSIALVFVSIHTFLCKFMVVTNCHTNDCSNNTPHIIIKLPKLMKKITNKRHIQRYDYDFNIFG